jgi:hypothetical protein
MSSKPFAPLARTRLVWAALALIALLGIVAAQGPAPPKAGAAKPNRYIGAEACKNCHQSVATGDQHGTWQKTGHAKAFINLGSDAAKKLAKDKGIDDPQKSDKCLKCHETAFGVPADQIKKGFEITAGVQCESCHGPGEQHAKARIAAAGKAGGGEGFGDEKGKAPAYQAIPAGEVIVNPEQKTCLGCHNEESPTFKPFCYFERVDKIRHDDPRKPRVKEDQLVCGCGEPCPCVKGCEEGKCAVKAKDRKPKESK